MGVGVVVVGAEAAPLPACCCTQTGTAWRPPRTTRSAWSPTHLSCMCIETGGERQGETRRDKERWRRVCVCVRAVVWVWLGPGGHALQVAGPGWLDVVGALHAVKSACGMRHGKGGRVSILCDHPFSFFSLMAAASVNVARGRSGFLGLVLGLV